MSSCGCGCAKTGNMADETVSAREIAVDLYYIDIDSCDRCQGASGTLREAIQAIAQSLDAMGVTVRLNETLVETAEQAEAVALVTSPSIRINGRDIQPDLQESTCKACSSLPNQSSVDCRVWAYRGEQFAAPPKGLIVEALMSAAMSPSVPPSPTGEYVMPPNLREFFANKAGAVAQGCGH